MAQNIAEGMASAEKYLVEISGANKMEKAEKNKNQTKRITDFFVRCEPIPTPKMILTMAKKMITQPMPIMK